MPDIIDILRQISGLRKINPADMVMDAPWNGGITGNIPVRQSPDIGVQSTGDTNTVDSTPDLSPETNPDIYARLAQIYKPQTNVGDQYRAALSQIPQREEPSKMRRIMGAIAGIGAGAGPATYSGGAALGFKGDPEAALAVSDRITNAPYFQKLGDWKTRLDALGKGATEEDKYNANQRMLALGSVQRDIQSANQKSAAEKRAADIQKDKDRTETQRFRAATTNYKVMHPNHDLKTDKEGRLVGIDPQTLKSTIITDDDGNPVISDKLPEADKINLQIKGRLQEIGAQGAQTRQTETAKETNRQTDITARGVESRKTKETIPGKAPSNSTTANTPAAEKTRQFTKAQQALNEHPEWSNYLKLGVNGANTFSLSLPSAWTDAGKKANKATFDQIHDYIYGSQATPAASERVKIADMTGKVIGTIPKSDISKMDTKKYKVVD